MKGIFLLVQYKLPPCSDEKRPLPSQMMSEGSGCKRSWAESYNSEKVGDANVCEGMTELLEQHQHYLHKEIQHFICAQNQKPNDGERSPALFSRYRRRGLEAAHGPINGRVGKKDVAHFHNGIPLQTKEHISTTFIIHLSINYIGFFQICVSAIVA